jgi:hypothetical protein
MKMSEIKALVNKLSSKYKKWRSHDYTKDQARIREIYGYEIPESHAFLAYCLGYLEAKKETETQA